MDDSGAVAGATAGAIAHSGSEIATSIPLKRSKRFDSAVEKALSSFESVNEWADHIYFLSRLLKVLYINQHENYIPHKSEIAAILLKCMSSSLPSGVHLKTIEIYSHIFTIEKRQLSDDFDLWFNGLESFLSYASIAAKPAFLKLIEDNLGNLGNSVSRYFKSIILALISAIDDHTTEHFDRIVALLDHVNDQGSDRKLFWQSIWEIVVANESHRLGALYYINSHMPSLSSADALTNDFLGYDLDLFFDAFCAGIQDAQYLSKRGFLDLIIPNLPLSTDLIQKHLARQKAESFIVAVTSVSLSKNASLTRRLWTYLNGNAAADQTNTADPNLYFRKYGKNFLLRGLFALLEMKNGSERAKGVEILNCLLMRWSIGGQLISELFLPALKAAFSAEEQEARDILKATSTLFDSADSWLIWSRIFMLQDESFQQKKPMKDFLCFILRSFNIRQDNMTNFHIPLLGISLLFNYGEAQNQVVKSEYRSALSVLCKFLENRGNTVREDINAENPSEIYSAIKRYYADESNKTQMEEFLSSSRLQQIIFDILEKNFRAFVENGLLEDEDFNLLLQLLKFLPALGAQLVQDIEKLFTETLLRSDFDLETLDGMLVLFEYWKLNIRTDDTETLSFQFVQKFIEQLWPRLHPSFLFSAEKAANILLRCCALFQPEAFGILIFKQFSEDLQSDSVAACERFITLWNTGALSVDSIVLERSLVRFLDISIQESIGSKWPMIEVMNFKCYALSSILEKIKKHIVNSDSIEARRRSVTTNDEAKSESKSERSSLKIHFTNEQQDMAQPMFLFKLLSFVISSITPEEIDRKSFIEELIDTAFALMLTSPKDKYSMDEQKTSDQIITAGCCVFQELWRRSWLPLTTVNDLIVLFELRYCREFEFMALSMIPAYLDLIAVLSRDINKMRNSKRTSDSQEKAGGKSDQLAAVTVSELESVIYAIDDLVLKSIKVWTSSNWSTMPQLMCLEFWQKILSEERSVSDARPALSLEILCGSVLRIISEAQESVRRRERSSHSLYVIQHYLTLIAALTEQQVDIYRSLSVKSRDKKVGSERGFLGQMVSSVFIVSDNKSVEEVRKVSIKDVALLLSVCSKLDDFDPQDGSSFSMCEYRSLGAIKTQIKAITDEIKLAEPEIFDEAVNTGPLIVES